MWTVKTGWETKSKHCQCLSSNDAVWFKALAWSFGAEETWYHNAQHSWYFQIKFSGRRQKSIIFVFLLVPKFDSHCGNCLKPHSGIFWEISHGVQHLQITCELVMVRGQTLRKNMIFLTLFKTLPKSLLNPHEQSLDNSCLHWKCVHGVSLINYTSAQHLFYSPHCALPLCWPHQRASDCRQQPASWSTHVCSGFFPRTSS